MIQNKPLSFRTSAVDVGEARWNRGVVHSKVKDIGSRVCDYRTVNADVALNNSSIRLLGKEFDKVVSDGLRISSDVVGEGRQEDTVFWVIKSNDVIRISCLEGCVPAIIEIILVPDASSSCVVVVVVENSSRIYRRC